MKRSMVRVVGLLLAIGGLVLVLSPAATPSLTDDSGTVGPPMFVVGDLSAGVVNGVPTPTIGTSVQFWGAQWAKNNSLSGGQAPASFKGYTDGGTMTTADGVLTGEWFAADPGNSSAPPATLGSPICVIVTSTVVKSGSLITGDVVAVAEVKPAPGYEPDPGHAGTGTIVMVGCTANQD